MFLSFLQSRIISRHGSFRDIFPSPSFSSSADQIFFSLSISIFLLFPVPNIFLVQISNRIFGFYSFLYIKLFPITPLLWLSPSYKIDPMSNLLFIKCSTIQNIIQTMVTYDSVDRLKFLSTMQVLEMAKNNIVL